MIWVVSVTPRLRFTPGERTYSTHWIGGWVSLRAGLGTEVRGKNWIFKFRLQVATRNMCPELGALAHVRISQGVPYYAREGLKM
jgi:hypothetical protein